MIDAKAPVCRVCRLPHPRSFRADRSTYICFACLDNMRKCDKSLNVFLSETEAHKTPEGWLHRRLYAINPYTEQELRLAIRECPLPRMKTFLKGLAVWACVNGGREHSEEITHLILTAHLAGASWWTRWAWYLVGGWRPGWKTPPMAWKAVTKAAV